MSENEGYIKLYRQILDNPVVCKDSDHIATWVFLLSRATYKNCPAIFNGKKIILNPGQLITGRKKISEKFSISESKVQRILHLFEKEHQIEQQTCNKNRLITIVEWHKYQSTEQQTEQQLNSKRTTTEQQVNTNKKDKKDKKDKNTDTSEDLQKIIDLYNGICKSLPKCIKLSETRKRHIKARLKDGYGEEDFRKVFEKAEASDFLTGRAEKWKANFDWLINENNLLKVLEGNYDNKTAAGNPFEF